MSQKTLLNHPKFYLKIVYIFFRICFRLNVCMKKRLCIFRLKFLFKIEKLEFRVNFLPLVIEAQWWFSQLKSHKILPYRRKLNLKITYFCFFRICFHFNEWKIEFSDKIFHLKSRNLKFVNFLPPVSAAHKTILNVEKST